VGGVEEVRAFFIEHEPLAATGDQAECAVAAEGGNIARRKRNSDALFFLGIERGDIDDFRGLRQTHAAVSAAAVEDERSRGGEE
jgi:hypothetical protein